MNGLRAGTLLAVSLLAGIATAAGKPCRPRLYVGLLGPSASLGYFGAVRQHPAVAGFGARVVDFRRFTERGWLCGASLFDVGFTELGARYALVAIRAGRLVHTAPRAFSYVALAAELMPGLALEYVLVPRAPWPVEFEARVGACYGTRYSSLPEFLPELQWQTSLGLRAGLGGWVMRED